MIIIIMYREENKSNKNNDIKTYKNKHKKDIKPQRTKMQKKKLHKQYNKHIHQFLSIIISIIIILKNAICDEMMVSLERNRGGWG